MAKFSGEYVLEVKDGFCEFDDYTLVGEYPTISDDVDVEEDVHKKIIKTQKYNELENGIYHVYFEGIIEFEQNYSYDLGAYDYDSYCNLDYFHFTEI
jgi:hypothetical protein